MSLAQLSPSLFLYFLLVRNSIHNVENGKNANKTSTVKKNFVEISLIVSTIWNVLSDIFHNVVSTIRIFYTVEITM